MTDRDIMKKALDALEIAEVDGNCCYEATELLRTRLTQPAPVQQELVRADEREACAKVCEELFADVPPYSAPDCAAAIRART